MPELVVSGVTKRYNGVLAVDNVSFDVSHGRIFGLLGPNGAGKTSTIRMITYITTPDRGSVTFRTREVGPWSQERMGYLPEERGLYKKMKVGEHLLYLAMLKGLTRRKALEKIEFWLDRFDAVDWYGKKVEELSKGMQQKVQFIATIMHDPDLLIFDEPFSGLDPINSELLRKIIVELKGMDKTILFASHRMEQVEQICDDICLMSSGKIVLQGPLRDVKSSFGKNTAIVEFDGDDAFIHELVEREAVRVVSRTVHRAELRLLDGTTARDVLESAMHWSDVYRFELVEPSLTEIFVSAVGKSRPQNGQAALVSTNMV